MNSTNQTLSFPRLGKLIQHEININQQIYVMIIPLAMISIMAVLLFSFSVSNSFSAMAYIPFLIIGYFIICFFLTGKSFPALGNKYSSTIYLTLPASTFEKFLVQGIFKLMIPILIYPFVFWLTANISVEFYRILSSIFSSSTGVLAELKPIEKFSFYKSGLYKKEIEPLTKLMVSSFYIAVPSVFFLGSLTFRKWRNIKTSVSFILLTFCYVCFLVLLSHILYPDITDGFNVRLNLGPTVMEDTTLIDLLSVIYISLVPVLAWTTAYWKLKEREV